MPGRTKGDFAFNSSSSPLVVLWFATAGAQKKRFKKDAQFVSPSFVAGVSHRKTCHMRLASGKGLRDTK